MKEMPCAMCCSVPHTSPRHFLDKTAYLLDKKRCFLENPYTQLHYSCKQVKEKKSHKIKEAQRIMFSKNAEIVFPGKSIHPTASVLQLHTRQWKKKPQNKRSSEDNVQQKCRNCIVLVQSIYNAWMMCSL